MITDWVAALSNAQERTSRKRMKRMQIQKHTQIDCFVMHTVLTSGRSDDVYREGNSVPIQ